jgi:hypothetical protein
MNSTSAVAIRIKAVSAAFMAAPVVAVLPLKRANARPEKPHAVRERLIFRSVRKLREKWADLGGLRRSFGRG